DRNPVLLAMRVRVDAERERLKAARAEKNPVLTAEIEGARYERQFGSRDRWRAGLTMEIPIFTGGRVDSAIASADAELHLLKARLTRKKMEIRQAILETWERINVLIIQRDEVRTLRDYRDLYLDRSRTLYGQGVKADLGDAMVKYTGSLLRRAETEFELALAWARLDSLTGRPVFVSKPGSPVNDIKPER
ncbi:MAG TPA: transporter, partial [Nitrospirae bacterium]|nr:transporter [Nitrospirota bacterium]